MRRNNKYEYSYTIKYFERKINNFFFTNTVPDMNSFTGKFFKHLKKK